jgi:ABC-2 type transport system permease protein
VLAASGVGALLATLCDTVRRAAALGLFLTLGMAALGGCWWPLEVVPPMMRSVALALPTGQAMHALIRLLVWGDPASSLWGAALYLLAFAAVTSGLGVAVMRRRLA